MTGPADMLENTVLPGGWIVGQKVTKKPGATGGSFSTGYFVSHPDGRSGFLKALDFSRASGVPPAAVSDVLKLLVDTYIFERDICVKCQESGVTRIVRAIDHGSIGGFAQNSHVDYLIFEKADGDVRAILSDPAGFDLAFAMRTLHGIAAALQQLHNAQIAHQDIKPSNVLVFTSQQKSKLADFGRAWAKGMPAPHDNYVVPGDPGYAPLELHANVPLSDDARRFGYDMYLLGSMVVFLFTQVHINALIYKHLDPSFMSHAKATFDDCLPYYQFAFHKALDEFELHVPVLIRAKLKSIVSELCNPDYTRRGNPTGTGLTRFSLHRYVSLFDQLRYQAESKP